MAFVYPDTLTERNVRLQPHGRPYVAAYVCGPTVYAPAHVGHGRTYLAFDLVRRYLHDAGVRTRHVMNVTDVEDKIDERARELRMTPFGLARQEERRFFRELDALHILRPTFAPRASAWVPRMVRIGRQLERRGFVERRGDSWWYSPPAHHTLRNFDLAADVARHAVREPNGGASRSRPDPRDFLIWKRQEAPVPTWSSPWGRGVPGWHLECYAMAQHYLGVPVDFQGGGKDLVFPHHYAQNEIALALEGTPFAHGFMHFGFVRDGGSKMSKSVGNLVPLGPASREYGASALRWYLLGRPYADPLDWSERDAGRARAGFRAVRVALRRSVAGGAGGSVSAAQAAALAGDVARSIGASLRVDRAFERIRRWTDSLGRSPRPYARAGDRPAVRAAYERVERLTGLELLGPR
ncbi:MAG: class I tRNA ligase family protein [Thermoplasmata archaeon]